MLQWFRRRRCGIPALPPRRVPRLHRFARAPFVSRRRQLGDRDDPSHHLFHFHNTFGSSHSAACFPYTSPHTSRSPIERDFALLTACRSDHVDRCVCIPYPPCFRCRLAPSRHRVASADGLQCTGLFSHLLAPVDRLGAVRRLGSSTACSNLDRARKARLSQIGIHADHR